MHTQDLCQALLDHIAHELPHERESLLGLAALLTFHPDEVRLFITEAVVLLLRTTALFPSRSPAR
jgi:alkylhydroperoxidase family enzyme